MRQLNAGFYVGDLWPLNFKVRELPENWESLRFVADIGLVSDIGDEAGIVIDLAKTAVPAGETAEGWLYGEARRDDTKGLAEGRYYIQISRWDNGQPQGERIEFTVLASFKRETSEPA